MVPQPVFAVVLLFPIRESIKAWKEQEDSNFEKEGLPAVDPTIMWIKQTVSFFLKIHCYNLRIMSHSIQISNACGTMGLLHALANVGLLTTDLRTLCQFISSP